MLGLTKRRRSERGKQDRSPSSPSFVAANQQSQGGHSNEPITASLMAIEKKLMEIGKELSCPICLGILEDAVSLPCTHCFCKDCFERSITIKPTRRDSLSTSSQCPLCKAHINKRSSSPADAIRILAKAYQGAIKAYEGDTGKQWETVESELSKQQLCSNPIENLSQLYPYPEKQQKKGVDVVIEGSKSPRSNDETGESDVQVMIEVGAGAAGIFPPSNPDDLIVCTSLLDKDQQELFMKWATTFSIRVSRHLTPDVRHLIVKTDSQRLAKKSLKYCQAVLSGRWIISFDWVVDSLRKGALQSYEWYEAKGDDSCFDHGAPWSSRMSRLDNEPELFSRIHFYFYGTFTQPSLHDLMILVVEGGGRIIPEASKLPLRRAETPSERHIASAQETAYYKHVIVVCDACQVNFERDAGIIQKFGPFATSDWILDCASAMTVLPIEPYYAVF